MPQKLRFSQHFCEKPDSETLFFLLSQPCWWQALNTKLTYFFFFKWNSFIAIWLSNFFQKKCMVSDFSYFIYCSLQIWEYLHIIKWSNFRALEWCCWSHIIKAKETAHKMFLKSTNLGVSSPNPCVSLAFFSRVTFSQSLHFQEFLGLFFFSFISVRWEHWTWWPLRSLWALILLKVE